MVRVLLSSPYSIPRGLINALDLIVKVDNNGRVSCIWELKWAEKSTISSHVYGYKLINMMGNEGINSALLKYSEAANLNIRTNPSSIPSFENEIAIRSEYLRLSGHNTERAGHSAAYFMMRVFGNPHKRIKYGKSRIAFAYGLSGVTARTEGCGPSRPGPTPG